VFNSRVLRKFQLAYPSTIAMIGLTGRMMTEIVKMRELKYLSQNRLILSHLELQGLAQWIEEDGLPLIPEQRLWRLPNLMWITWFH
jgi:hypothetical protein